jgi:hypothetical protein
MLRKIPVMILGVVLVSHVVGIFILLGGLD